MDAEKLIYLAESADFRVRSYSGRGGYGRRCVGIEVDGDVHPFTVGAVLAATAAELDEDPQEVAELVISQDQIGRDTILYFQGVSWPEDREGAA